MKKFLLTSAIIFSLGANANAGDEKWPYWYVGLNAGGVVASGADYKAASKGNLDPDNAFAYSATIGYAPSNLRLEAEFGASDQDIGQGTATGSVRTYKGMVNAIFDTDTSFGAPYIGGGIGIVKADISPTNTPSISGSDSKMGYQALAGFNLGEVAPNVLANVGYRYVGTFNDFKINGTKINYDAHQVEAGLKFRF